MKVSPTPFVLISALCICLLWLLDNTHSQAAEIRPTSKNWEKAIQQFEASDRSHPVKSGGNLFIGSSSIRMWKSLASDFPQAPVINRGFGGSQIVDSTYFAPRIVIPYAPKQIFLYAGDNDVAAGKNAETVLADFKTFVKTVHAALPKTRIHFIAIKPSLRRWSMAEEMTKANGRVKEWVATDDRLHFIDVWNPMLDDSGKPDPKLFIKDGLHMNRAGYDIWTAAIRPSL